MPGEPEFMNITLEDIPVTEQAKKIIAKAIIDHPEAVRAILMVGYNSYYEGYADGFEDGNGTC